MEFCFSSFRYLITFVCVGGVSLVSFKGHSTKCCAFHVENHCYKERSLKSSEKLEEKLAPPHLPLMYWVEFAVRLALLHSTYTLFH